MANATSAFLAALRAGCETCRIRNVRLLVAVSGGADSVALLGGLCRLPDELGIRLEVAHLNHQLRGAESDADAAWVVELCHRWQIPCHLGSESIVGSPEASKLGTEGAARLVRRRFLQRVAVEQQCAGIAVAHTADDQAETILHHILRGTGLGGLRGMHADEVPAADEGSCSDECDSQLQARGSRTPQSGIPFVRPLLRVERALLERFLIEQEQSYRTDASNADTAFTRNRIRHELLPLLARDFNPQIRQALLRLGQQAQDVYAEEAIRAGALLREALIEAAESHCRLRCQPFQGQPPSRIRECFVLLWRQQDWPRRQMGFDDWERLVKVLEPQHPAITLPSGIIARRRDDLLMLTKQP